MKPPARAKMEFERIPKYDEWIEGTISDIEYDENHKSTYQGEEKIRPCVRFKFGLKGCEFPHRSKWLTFSYGEKANLYKQFISVLVNDAEPDMDFDLDALKGFKIKTMWTEAGEYDNLAMIRPLVEKIGAGETTGTPIVEDAEDVPF